MPGRHLGCVFPAPERRRQAVASGVSGLAMFVIVIYHSRKTFL
jgi:hypothetical protein